MTHKLLQLGQDVQNRRRAVGESTTGSWVELCRFVHLYDATQLNSTSSWVELSCRYKRGFSFNFQVEEFNYSSCGFEPF